MWRCIGVCMNCKLWDKNHAPLHAWSQLDDIVFVCLIALRRVTVTALPA